MRDVVIFATCVEYAFGCIQDLFRQIGSYDERDVIGKDLKRADNFSVESDRGNDLMRRQLLRPDYRRWEAPQSASSIR